MKIALIEKKENIDFSELDKVISFQYDDHTHINEYLVLSELREIYDEVYLKFDLWLKEHIADKTFLYHDVDILQAYGKRIFDFTFNITQKAHAVKQVINKESPQELWISQNIAGAKLRCPYLDFFISDFVSSDASLKYFNGSNAEKPDAVTGASKRPSFTMYLFDSLRRLSNLFCASKGAGILVYSDLQKIPTLFDHIDSREIICLREKLPPRLIPYFIKKRVRLKLFSDYAIAKVKKAEILKATRDFISKMDKSSKPLVIDGKDLAPYLRKHIAGLWQEELTDLLEKVEQAHLLFQEAKPRSLLVDEDRAVYKNLFVQVSKQYNCRSYVNSHGDPFHKITVMPLIADYMLVWGDLYKKRLAEWGIEEKRMIVVGCSKYDKYLKRSDQAMKSKISKDLGLLPSRPIVLIASYPFELGRDIWREKTAWDKLKVSLAALSRFQEIEVIIKLHPGDNSKLAIDRLVKKLKINNIKVIRDYDPLVLAKGADILIINISTFAIDGMAFKKPVILTNRYKLDEYRDLNVFYDGHTEGILMDSVKNILNGSYTSHIDNWRYAIESCLNGLQGTASNRIAEILNKR